MRRFRSLFTHDASIGLFGLGRATLVGGPLLVSLLLAGGCNPDQGGGDPASADPAAAPAGGSTAASTPAKTPAGGTSPMNALDASKPTPAAASGSPDSGTGRRPVAPASTGDTGASGGGKEYVVITTADGEIVIELDAAAAPTHANNFRKLVQNGFYTGNAFHRAVDGGLVQAGDPDPKGSGAGSVGVPLAPEIGLKHTVGAVGMAREVDQVNPNRRSSGSQFYICLGDLPELDSLGYTVFGQVVKGLDVAAKVRTGSFSENYIVPPDQRTRIQKAELRNMDITPEPAETKPAAIPESEDEYAVLETDVKTGDGKIVIDVFEESTPKHAANFKKLVREGFYDGLTFHRVIEGFMAQGGDPQGTGSGGPGYTLEAEIGLKHLRGSVSAARQGDRVNPQRRSSGSQFFVCFEPKSHLDDGGYSVFGHVVKGMSVVDNITRGSRTQNGSVPRETRTRIVKAYLVPASSVQPETPSPAK